MPGSVRVLDIPLYDADIPSAVNLVASHLWNAERGNHCISATGAHGLVFARKNPSFRTVLKGFFMNLPDGMPGVWIGRIKGARNMKRCYGPDFFKALLTHTANMEVNHFFCGGNQGVAEDLREKVATRFQNRHVTGVYCPPYLGVDEYDYPSIARMINESKADVVWIGLSTPKQEQFAAHLAGHSTVKFIITVGAAFDFHTDRVDQAPSWIQKAGLEWFYRLVKEPRRLYKRYLEIVPLFLFYNLGELANFAAKKIGIK